MDSTSENVCRLCLKINTNDNLKKMESSSFKMLERVLHINLANTDVVVTCKDCTKNLEQFSDFISRIGNIQSSYNNSKSDTKADKNKLVETSSMEDYDEICSFCGKRRDRLVKLSETNEKECLLWKYIPELAGSSEFLYCDTCFKTLQKSYKFVKNCLDVEQKISSKEVNHNSLTSQTVVKKEKPSETTEIFWSVNPNTKPENLLEEMEVQRRNIESLIKNENVVDGFENFIVKTEYIDPEELGFTLKHEVDTGPTNNVNEWFNASTSSSDSQKLSQSDNLDSKCTPNPEQVLVSPLEKNKYKCGFCDFETSHKKNLPRHFMVHKNAAEISTHKCNMCNYAAKDKYYLKRHMLSHKSPSEVTMYKCDKCAFQTKYQRALSRHLLTHKDKKVTVLTCELCSLETTSTWYLKRHKALCHKGVTEAQHVAMYKCGLCSYESGIKKYVAKHMVTHKKPSEIKMYACEICGLESKYKYSLKKHLMVHQNAGDVTMYKCGDCEYETRRKDALKRHCLVHKKKVV